MDSIIWTVALMAVVGLVGSVLLLIVSRKFAVGEDERLTYLTSILPGVNCGSCGYPGCAQYAHAMLDGTPPNACSVGGARVAAELAAYLGVEATGVVQHIAFVACQSSTSTVDPQLSFKGTPSCRVFSTMFYASLNCPFGCLGFGDCADACPFEAISVESGIARINPHVCTGCGKCLSICPRHIISIVDQGNSDGIATVTCKNTMPAKKTREVCKIGCIGCKKCVKACPAEAISVENNLARVDATRCTNCGACIETCPTHAISKLVFQ